MAYQFVREPLRAEEADRLSNACKTTEEKLIVWTLLDTGLRVSELCSLVPENVQWQQRSIRVKGKGEKTWTSYDKVPEAFLFPNRTGGQMLIGRGYFPRRKRAEFWTVW